MNKAQSSKKILLLGDYSNCHANLGEGLRNLGHNVTIMAPVNYLSSKKVDINIKRKEGKLGGLLFYLKLLTTWHKYLKGYDIVAINDPVFLSLRPERLAPLFKRLKAENGSLFYTAMSHDINYLRMCSDSNSPLKFSEYFIEGKPSPWNLENPQRWKNWFKPELMEYQDYVFENLDGAISVLYEYHKGLEYLYDKSKITYGGIPINTKEIQFVGSPLKSKVRLMLGKDRRRVKVKGSDILEKAARNIIEKYPNDVELFVAENLPYEIFIEEIKKSDVILDQVYSYTPATTALLSMAMGKTVVSGGEPEYYDFIGEKDNHPIINASYNLEKMTRELENVVLDRDFIKNNSIKSRDFVIKHNDSELVAKRFLEQWNKNLIQ
ncbi:MAG: hypothetical protein J1F67_02435 [Muribaculaceae bacterium]|nr:hypothetical protein [Muribaculaceae bacterium]